MIDANVALAKLANSISDDSPSQGVAYAIRNRMTHVPELHTWCYGGKWVTDCAGLVVTGTQ
ncbi:MAG: hypothetical protein ACSLEN_02890 [Candidatus Malihini olakiniferum]